MLSPNHPALVFAPMDGVTDAPMRDLMGDFGAFSYCVTEFIRVSASALPAKVFRRDIPELNRGSVTPSGLPIQVQLLGGDPDRLAASALAACQAGAIGIDLNFGCPAPTVNRNDGGASLLRHPCRIRDLVSAVRQAVPTEVPVSAKLRLGWDSIDPIEENAHMAAEGGASWLTIHARTRVQNYAPPVFWPSIARVKQSLPIPIIANGDIWTFQDFQRCQEETGCDHFMIGRSALANPTLPWRIAHHLGISNQPQVSFEWLALFRELSNRIGDHRLQSMLRLKQWMKIAYRHGDFPWFDELKRAESLDWLLLELERLERERTIAMA